MQFTKVVSWKSAAGTNAQVHWVTLCLVCGDVKLRVILTIQMPENAETPNPVLEMYVSSPRKFDLRLLSSMLAALVCPLN